MPPIKTLIRDSAGREREISLDDALPATIDLPPGRYDAFSALSTDVPIVTGTETAGHIEIVKRCPEATSR